MRGRAAGCLAAALLACIAHPAAQGAARQKASVSITISAAASLSDALTEVRRAFARVRPDIDVALNFGASGALELQIERGAPVDAFVSAAPQPMDALADKHLLRAETRVELLQNELVLIVPQGSQRVANFADLSRADVGVVAMGDPRTVPAGAYAQQVLTALGIYEAVRRKATLATDVRQVLADVETGSADAGLVYATDARISSRVRVAASAPQGTHEPIVYPAAVLRDAMHPDAARAFVDFLKGDGARAIFVQYGFRPVSN
jgi:molybdate transport system substrate-binding protein